MRSSESGDTGNTGTGAAAALVTDSHSCQMLVRSYTVDTDKDQETVFLPLRCDLTWLIWFLLGALQVAVLLLTWSAVVNTSPQCWNIYRDQTVNSIETLVLRPEAWHALQRDISSLSIAAFSRLNFLIIYSQLFTHSFVFDFNPYNGNVRLLNE